MAKITRVPSPGPDDPIFSEGFTLSSGRLSKGPAASPANDADEKTSDESEKPEARDKADGGGRRKHGRLPQGCPP